jgi:uncharacterized protein (TIGR04255 family)
MEGLPFKPVAGKHSINRVIANLFVPQKILKPDLVFNFIRQKENFSTYQRKSLTESKTINIVNDIPNTSKEIDGFIFEEFDPKGKSKYVFRVKNESNKAQVNLENRIYTTWDDFKSKLVEGLANLSSEIRIFAEAVSLTYVDEFIWLRPEEIDVKKILEEGSEILNKDFFNSYNGTLILLSQSKPSEKNSFEEQKIEITFNNAIKRIVINHSIAVKFKDITYYDSEDNRLFMEYFDEAHDKNKDILRRILREEVQHLINL